MKVFRVEVNALLPQLAVPVQKVSEMTECFHVEAKDAEAAVRLLISEGRARADKSFLVTEPWEVLVTSVVTNIKKQ